MVLAQSRSCLESMDGKPGKVKYLETSSDRWMEFAFLTDLLLLIPADDQHMLAHPDDGRVGAGLEVRIQPYAVTILIFNKMV